MLYSDRMRFAERPLDSPSSRGVEYSATFALTSSMHLARAFASPVTVTNLVVTPGGT